jgi:ParB-like chromosome segregation protein Spo0J
MKEVKNTYYEDYLKWKKERHQDSVKKSAIITIVKAFLNDSINEAQYDFLIEKAEAKWKNTDEKGDLSVDDIFTQKFNEKSKIFAESVKKYLDDKWGTKTKEEFDEKFEDEAKIKEVDIKDIIPTQKYVSRKIMDEKMDNVHFKESNIQIFKFDGKYYLYDGHHRTSALIEEGFKEVKDNVLKLSKIDDFEKDIEKFLPKEFDLYEIVDKSVTSTLNKAFEDNLINEEQYNLLLEKAWKKQPIGTTVTHKDGKKYKKVSETGTKQDWQLVTKDKSSKEGDSKANKSTKDQSSTDTQPSKKELKEHAKNTSETALTNTVKQSADPVERQAAHEELKRREEEEKPKDEKDLTNPKKVKEEFDKTDFVEKFRTLSDEQIKFYLDAPFENVKKAAKTIADERGLNIISKEDYIKSFEDFTEEDGNSLSGRLSDQYKKDSKLVRGKLSLESNKSQLDSINLYMGNGFVDVRSYLIDKDKYVSKQKEIYKGDEDKRIKETENTIANLSSFINDNKIEKDIVLNRMVTDRRSNPFFSTLKEGDVYEDKSFSSTSLKKLFNFGDFNIKILAKKGSNVANIDNPGEFEYIINKESKFRVVEKHENGLGITVELL